MNRRMVWKQEDGWGCSNCLWRYPVYIALTDPLVRSRFDRLATARYSEHSCNELPAVRGTCRYQETFLEKMRMLVLRGLKPGDAVERILREVSFRYRDDPEMISKAREEGVIFLRRVREGNL